MSMDVWDRRLRTVQHVLAGLTGAIAAVSILGWLLGTLILASLSNDYVPMAPVTAITFLALCAVLIFRLRTDSPRAHTLVLGVAGLGCAVAVLELVDFAFGLPVAPDRLIVPLPAVVSGVQTGRMSPVTAIALAALFVALALFESRRSAVVRGGVALSLLVSAGACLLLVGYMYDAPLLYTAGLVPVALPTSAGLALLGIGVAGLAGADRWPFTVFVGGSVRSQLMRGVLPVVMVTTLAVATLDAGFHRLGLIQDPALISALFILTFSAVSVMVLRSASRIGGNLDESDARRRLAEGERDAYRHHLEELVEVRTSELAQANEGLRSVNEELNVTNEELIQATTAKSQFLANMSHELRTPLNSIIGFAGVLTQGLAGDLNVEQHKQLTMVRRSGERLLALINDILDLSRIEAGKAVLKTTDVNARDIVTAAAGTIRPLAEEAGLELIVGDVPEDVSLRTDEQKLHQVLVNLLANAVKFTDAGHVSVSVRESEKDHVVFAVADTGVGIAHEDLAAIFDEFIQVSHERGKPEGTGLGLAISRRLVALLGGTLTATSIVDHGSTFVVDMPCVYRGPADSSERSS